MIFSRLYSLRINHGYQQLLIRVFKYFFLCEITTADF